MTCEVFTAAEFKAWTLGLASVHKTAEAIDPFHIECA